MKKRVIKKMVALILIVSCLAGMATGANATSYTISLGADHVIGYSSSRRNYYKSTNYTTNLTSVGFIGLPPGVMPYGSTVNFALFSSKSTCNSGTNTHSSLGSVSSIHPLSSGKHYLGGWTTASIGATVGVTITP